jgi:hypothetical protein
MLPAQYTSQYLSPIPINQTTTIEAVAASDNYLQSAVVTAVYTITSLAKVTVTPSASSITTAQPLNVTITVSGPNGDPVPTGSITLTGGGYVPMSPVALIGGSVTVSIPAGTLLLGTDTLTANYSPDSTSASIYNGITGSVTVTVTTAPTPGLTLSGTAVTVAAGATTGNTSTITVTPSGGLTGGVTLSAAIATYPGGDIYLPTLSFGSTSPVNITGTSAGTATLTISTTAGGANQCVAASEKRSPLYGAGGAVLACVLLWFMPTRRRRLRTFLWGLALLVALGGGLVACGAGSGSGCNTSAISGTPRGTYTITVTGGAGVTEGTTIVTLNVQ